MGEELKFVPGKGLLDGEEVVAEFDVRVLTIYYFISQTGKRVKKAYDILFIQELYPQLLWAFAMEMKSL